MGKITNAIALAGLLSLCSPIVYAGTTYTSLLCGSGVNNIPDATGTAPGSLACVIPIFDPGVIAIGNVVTLSLLGLQHDSAADLEVRLTHFADPGLTIILGSPQTAFSRIGKTSNDPADFGYLPQFGDPNGTADNYFFNTGFPGDLWTTASLLGSAEFIPGQAQGEGLYRTASAFRGTPNAFSSNFAGQTRAGYWRLNITDYAEGPTPGSTGTLQQFAVTFEDAARVPEPSYTAVLALLFTAGALLRFHRHCPSTTTDIQ